MDFLHAVRTETFMQNALLTGVLAGVACGVVGAYVVVRRITVIAGSISHCILGGMGAARYLQTVYGVSWAHPLLGATVAALIAALVIGVVSLRAKQREDMVIGAVWAIGMAIGILFIARTPGYNEDLMSYLFGNILMVSGNDLYLIAGLDVLVVAVGLLFYNQLLAICFDEEFARLRGVPVEGYYLMLLCLAAITVVLLVSVVGIVMVIALLTLPVAVAGQFSRTLWQLMAISSLLTVLFTTTGLAFSFGPDLPPGATSILIAAAVYLLVLIGGAVVRKMRRTASTA